jgi:hypothetical protein
MIGDRKDGDADLVAALRAAWRSGARPRSDEPHPEDAAFASYVSGTLAPSEQELFERHVSGCASCAEDLAEVARVEAFAAEAASGAVARPDVESVAAASARAPHRRPSQTVRNRRERPAVRASGARRSRLARRLAVAAVAVLAVSIGLVAGGNVVLERWAPTAAARLGQALGRKVEIGDLSIAFLPGPALRVDRFRIADDPRFSSEDLVTVASADLAVDAESLWRGRVYGSVRIDRPTMRLVRGPRGEWNVETLAGERSRDRADEGAAASAPREGSPPSDVRVRLASASVRSGTLAVTDRSGGREREIVLRDVDLDYLSSAASEPAKVSLEGEIGGRAVVLRGEIGPFEGAAAPRYRFAEVTLADVDLAHVPGAPAAVTGRISFAGELEGVGRSLAAVVQTVSGAGSLDLCCGALAQRNLDRDVIDALDAVTGAPGRLAGALAATPGAAAVLAASATDYRRLGGTVAIDPDRLTFSDLGVQTRLLAATTEGDLTRDGRIDARGSVTLGPELTQALLAAAPALRPALERSGEASDAIALPFVLAGRWPDVSLRVDVAATLASAARALDPRRLAWSFLRSPARG